MGFWGCADDEQPKKYLIILREHKLSLKILNVINVEGKKTNVENSFLLQPDSNLNTASLLKDLRKFK